MLKVDRLTQIYSSSAPLIDRFFEKGEVNLVDLRRNAMDAAYTLILGPDWKDRQKLLVDFHAGKCGFPLVAIDRRRARALHEFKDQWAVLPDTIQMGAKPSYDALFGWVDEKCGEKLYQMLIDNIGIEARCHIIDCAAMCADKVLQLFEN